METVDLQICGFRSRVPLLKKHFESYSKFAEEDINKKLDFLVDIFVILPGRFSNI